MHLSLASAPTLLVSKSLFGRHRITPSNQKLLIIFGRGGNDSLNTFVPHGDPDYRQYREADTSNPNSGGSDLWFGREYTNSPRKTIRLPVNFPGSTSVTSGVYFEMHPKLAKLKTLMSQGRAAILGRVGNGESIRSHFKEMRIIETGRPRSLGAPLEEGWGARLAAELPASDLKAVSVSPIGQRILFTRDVGGIATVWDLWNPNLNYSIPESPPNTAVSSMMEGEVGPPPRGLLGHLAAGRTGTTEAFDFARDSGVNYFEYRAHFEAVQQNNPFVHNGSKFPTTPTEAASAGLSDSLAGRVFMDAVEEAMHLLRYSDASIAGVDLASFDTHSNQLDEHNSLLAYLAHALKSADEVGQQDPANDYLILFMTEFGRTVKSNGNGGTDHGVASDWIVVGDNLNHGIYNMKAPGSSLVGYGSEWQPLIESFALPTSTSYNALEPATDYRTVIAEILMAKFGMAQDTVNIVLGHQFMTAPVPKFLNFMA
ncbi:MAG: DUF1501 domain-containing protein [Planctomycetes bacterium]|nr:DUF1501 domain-containing protein [Planctomycetota bacterium]